MRAIARMLHAYPVTTLYTALAVVVVIVVHALF